METVTLTQLATDALQDLGVLDQGETPATAMLDEALRVGNNMIASWSIDRLMAVSALVSTFTLTNGTASYTIGTGGTWNIARPAAIEAAAVLISSGPTMPVQIIDAAAWSKIPQRDKTSPLVKYLFYDRAEVGSPVLGKVYLSPVPTGGSIELITWAALSPFADKTTALSLSDGYVRMLRTALAIELAPRYDMKPTEALVSRFQEARDIVRKINASILGAEPPAGGKEE